MTDEEFVGYCELHSMTPRALFFRKDAVRIMRLGDADGADEMSEEGDGFYSLTYDTIGDVLKRARRKIEQRKRGVA